MRALALVALAGCTQLFGLSEPHRRDGAVDDASDGAADTEDGLPLDATGPQACGTADPALLACFDFEDSIENLSLYSVPVTAVNYMFATGRQGKAVRMDASTTFVMTNDAVFDQTQITVEAWIFVEALPAAGLRMGVWDTDGQFGLFVRDTGALYCSNVNGVTSAVGLISVNQWAHVACSTDVSAVREYKDGVLVVSGTGGVLATTGANGSAVGGNAPSGERFVGLIDSLRVYNYARSAAQICTSAGC